MGSLLVSPKAAGDTSPIHFRFPTAQGEFTCVATKHMDPTPCIVLICRKAQVENATTLERQSTAAMSSDRGEMAANHHLSPETWPPPTSLPYVPPSGYLTH